MERLQSDGPVVKLTEEQKEELASIETKFRAKIAEKELFLQGLITKAQETGDLGEIAQLQQQLSQEMSRLERDMEDAKEKIRNPTSGEE
ncbi:MAG: hypothetical protein AAF191_09935 [Verrucomicrobiota bacterium]